MSAMRNFELVGTENAAAPVPENGPACVLTLRESNARLLWLRAKSPHTARAYTSALLTFLGASGHNSIGSACADYETASASIAAFTRVTERAGYSTRNTRYSAIRRLLTLCEKEAVYTWGVAHHLVPTAKKAEGEAIRGALPAVMPSLAQCIACIELEPVQRNRLMFKLMFYGGLRAFEVCGLTRERIFWRRTENGSPVLTLLVFGKGGVCALVDLHEALGNELWDFAQLAPDDGSLFGIAADRLGVICRRAWKRVAYENPGPQGAGAHIWRHAFKTYGKPDKAAMRHSRELTSEIYNHAVAEPPGAKLPWVAG